MVLRLQRGLRRKRSLETANVLVRAKRSQAEDLRHGGDLLVELFVRSCREADLALVRYFLSDHQHLVNRAARHATPLIAACAAGRADVVKLLLAAGAERGRTVQDGWNALMECAERGHDDCAALLLDGTDDAALLASSLFPDGWTPLLIACHHQHPETVALFLAKGSDPAAETTVNGWTALMSASYNDNTDIVRALLAHGAPVDQTKDDDGVALMCAAFRGSNRACRLLLEAGAEVNRVMLGRISALMLAVEEGHDACARTLCLFGAQVPLTNFEGESALDIARATQQHALAAFLGDSAGRGPLQRAAEARDRGLCEQILASAAPICCQEARKVLFLATSRCPLYGLPVNAELARTLHSALFKPWTPRSDGLFPPAFRRRARYLLASHLLSKDLWVLVLSFLSRND